MMAGAPITIWQWNCRGFRQKRRALEYTIQHYQTKPDILALQETGVEAKLSGFTTYNEILPRGNSPATAIMVHRNLTANQIDLEYEDLSYTFVEVLPNKRSDHTLYILNIYSPPKDKSQATSKLMVKAYKYANRAPLIILGDFNAQHSAWGYQKCATKGTKLWETAQNHGFTLLNNLERPTRIGNSVSRNTSPDLTFVRNIENATWENTEANVGSDHYILTTTVSSKGYKRYKPKIKRTRWDVFRYIRDNRDSMSVTNLKEWVSTLVQDANNATTEAEMEEDGPTPDARLIHLWDAQKKPSEKMAYAKAQQKSAQTDSTSRKAD